ncbi:DUF2182 domain-containing protein [Jannaschia sp. W003]|uniref:DUF2182 domain-containing protein n=1 Tax=Jannaschia sp. W003 TaxID=2867012 RepID=UPI0021A28086|nr:DUF2182 domain-containing protein [Jannaschia sp. W003]UWQ20532.1 DUF2182 domain-containing protein [Jannaschia sp. W003]
MRDLGRMTAPHWLALYGAILGAWAVLWLWAAPAAPDFGALLVSLCRATPEAAGWGGAFAMWVLMAAAMMLPTALPAFATYDEIAHAHRLGGGATLVAGYGAVWLGFAGVATAAQMLAAPEAFSPAFAAAMLVLAAAYQVSPLKEACLSRCRMPLTFFMAHWNDGPWRMGLRLGAVCLGCCWALMALALVGGAMSLGFMALATVLMTLEKLGRGTLVPRAIAIACLAGAGFLIGGLS